MKWQDARVEILKDKLVSILDDYAEYVLWEKLGGSMFSGAINQDESIEEIIEAIKPAQSDLIDRLVSKLPKPKERLDDYSDSHNAGYNQALSDIKAILLNEKEMK